MKIYRIVLFTALSILLFYPPYLRGLFFDAELLPTHIYSFALFILFLGYKFLKKDYSILKNKLDYAVLGMVAVFLLPIIFGQAANMRSAIGEFLRYCNFFAVYIMVRDLVQGEKTLKILLNVVIASAVGVALFGIDAAAGEHMQKFIGDIVHYKFFDGFVAGRMNSTLQYPNTLAAYLMAIFFVVMGMQIDSKKVWQKAIYGAAGFILLMTFILTYSRGAMLLFPVIYLIFIIVLFDIYKVCELILSSGAMLLISGILLQPMTATISDKNTVKIWLFMLGGTAASILISIVIKYIIGLLLKIDRKKITIYTVSLLFVMLTLATGVGIVALNTEKPVVLSHENNEEVSRKYSTKEIANIESDTDYILLMNLETKSNVQNLEEWDCRITINSINEKREITEIIRKTYKNENGQISIPFRTNKDTETIYLAVENYYPGTSLKFENTRLSLPDGSEKKIIFLYKYIPENVVQRFTNLAIKGTNAFQRVTFNIDGLKIVKDYLLFGAGGKAWEYLVFKYQSYWYYTTQAHNYFLQVLIDTGIIGFAALIVFLIFLGSTYLLNLKKLKENLISKVLGVALISLFVHSIMDFDFSLVAVFLLVWIFAGLLNSIGIYSQEQGENSSKNEKGKGILISVGTAGIVLLAVSISFNASISYAMTGAKAVEEKDLIKAKGYYEKAIGMDAFQTTYKTDLAQIYNSLSIKKENGKSSIADKAMFDKAEELFQTALRYNRFSPRVNALAASFYMDRGDVDKGLEYIEKSTQYHPMNNVSYEQKADAYYTAGLYYYGKDMKKSKELLEKVKAIAADVAALNKPLRVPVKLTDRTLDKIERAGYVLEYFNMPEKLIGFNNIVFVSRFDIDSDNNTVPDGWTKTAQIKSTISANEVRLENTTDKKGYLTSRNLELEQNENYSLILTSKGTVKNFQVQILSRTGNQVQILSETIVPKNEYMEYKYNFTIPDDTEEEAKYIKIDINENIDSGYIDLREITIKKNK